MKTRFVVPTDPAAVQGWAADFVQRYGLPPIAGGETSTVTPETPAAPAAAPEATPAATPAAGEPAATPAAGEGASPAAEAPPAWAQSLIDGMETLMPPAPVDPLAVELGLVPAPAQPLPGQPGHDPSQTGSAAGQPQTGALPTPDPASPASGAAPQQVPGEEAVNQLIDSRAREVAATLLKEQVVPYFRQQEGTRRRTETQSLLDDYPELKDPAKGNALVAQAKAWAQETLGDASKASEPGFLEITHLAMRQMAANEAAKAGAGAPGASGGEVPLEGAGASGAQPAAQTQEQRAQAIVDAKPGGGLSSIWV